MLPYKTIDEQFVRNNFKDPDLAEAIIQSERKRGTTITLVLGSLLIVASIAIGYAVKETNRANSIVMEAELTFKQTDNCRLQAMRQMKEAAEKRKMMEGQHQAIQDQLAACRKK